MMMLIARIAFPTRPDRSTPINIKLIAFRFSQKQINSPSNWLLVLRLRCAVHCAHLSWVLSLANGDAVAEREDEWKLHRHMFNGSCAKNKKAARISSHYGKWFSGEIPESSMLHLTLDRITRHSTLVNDCSFMSHREFHSRRQLERLWARDCFVLDVISVSSQNWFFSEETKICLVVASRIEMELVTVSTIVSF